MVLQRWNGKITLKIASGIPFLAFGTTVKTITDQWIPNKLSDGTTPVADHLDLIQTDPDVSLDLFPSLLTVGGGSSKLTIFLHFSGKIEYFKEK